MVLAASVRDTLIIVNAAAVILILGVIGYRVLSVRREKDEKEPQNVRPFLDDDTLETRHLERVLRWAFLFSVIVAIGLPVYWLHEPARQNEEQKGYDERSVERGKVLFSNAAMTSYDPTQSLQCANCHGVDAGGGSASFVVTPDILGNANDRPVQVTWQAPALNSVLSRFNSDQLTQIITYGRPGTPMPPWGILGGGPKGDQSIGDLVAYLQSIQISKTQAAAQVTKSVSQLESQAKQWVTTSEQNLQTAEQAGVASDIADAQRALSNSQAWAAEVAQAPQGQLLFDVNCARCHTKGWSFFDPSNPLIPATAYENGGTPGNGLPVQGGGAFGPNLTNGDTLRQFPGDTGLQKQLDWVTIGADPEKPYGVRGISSGRMPHFGEILTPAQIKAIVEYERSL